MTDSGVPKLCDFGQARSMKYTFFALVTANRLNPRGTLNWIAPEIAEYIDKDTIAKPGDSEELGIETICTRRSDMWSYGMVICVSYFFGY